MKKIENIVIYSNLLTAVKEIVSKVGYQIQAPLSDAELDEVIASSVMHCVEEKVKNEGV